MRGVGMGMMIVGLIAALFAAASACLAPMRLSSGTLSSLTLGEGAGAVELDAVERAAMLQRAALGEIAPETALAAIDARPPRFAPTGADGEHVSLTNAQLDELRQKDALGYLHVREFDFTRWPHWWAFVLGATSLGVGAMVLRDATRASRARQAVERARANALGAPERAGAFLPLQLACVLVDALARARRQAASHPCAAERMSDLAASMARLLEGPCANVRESAGLLEALVGRPAWLRTAARFAQIERALARARCAAADGLAPAAEGESARAASLLEELERELGLLRMRLGG